MIRPSQQWCQQIDVTNACTRACSNCTRLVGHVVTPFFMSIETFTQAAHALAEFPTKSLPCPKGRRKVVGMIGGEPLLHPEFPALVDIFCEFIPNPAHRGLWTGLDWQKHPYRESVLQLLGGEPSTSVQPGSPYGYLNHNPHDPPSTHQPILVASEEVVPDENDRWMFINACWVQRYWSGSITPKGYFFCEVAAALDMVMQGAGGRPLTPDCWRCNLGAYRQQVAAWCHRCGACLPMPGRIDHEGIDDVSPLNYKRLSAVGSPRVAAGKVVMSSQYLAPTVPWKPWAYL